MRLLLSLILMLALIACNSGKQKADLLITNARIYSVDSVFGIYEAMAITDGKIVSIGTTDDVLSGFESDSVKDVEGRPVVPGLIDAHCHFVGYGLGLQRADLTGTASFEDVLRKVTEFARRKAVRPEGFIESKVHAENEWIIGRGWDQNDWENKSFPDRRLLDSIFPDVPVMLIRIDGHAALINAKAMDISRINSQTVIKGGQVEVKNRRATGILIDNAVDLVKSHIPTPSKRQFSSALLEAQQNCLAMGLTTLSDAGLMHHDVDLIDSLQKNKLLHLRMYIMLSDSAVNYEKYISAGPVKKDKLHVCSFKFYADGALGSRGACLKEDYTDKKGWKGFLLSEIKHFEEKAALLAEKGFQVNTHCIGDSAAKVILSIYKKHCSGNGKMRWRIEHAQVISGEDFKFFNKDIIPSVQPTHATSDMYWAADRLGQERVRGAYAYRQLLERSGILALGTDFPVEDVSPFKTFYAAIARKDSKGFPEGGFQMENSLTREQTLKGMTIWAAYANFEEKEKGSLEPGKFADFVILNNDIMTCHEKEILNTKVLSTYIGGKRVY